MRTVAFRLEASANAQLEADRGQDYDDDDEDEDLSIRCVFCGSVFQTDEDIAWVDSDSMEPTDAPRNALALHLECFEPYGQARLRLWEDFGFLPPGLADAEAPFEELMERGDTAEDP